MFKWLHTWVQLQALRQLENWPQLDYEGPRQRQTHEDDAQMHPLRLRNPQVLADATHNNF